MTPTITLYSFLPSQNAVRTEIALREKGLEYERIALDLLKGEHKRPPLTDVTPRGQVPTLVYQTEGEPIVVYESLATIRFLDDMHPEPALMPPVSEPRARAVALMRMEEFQAKLDAKNIFGSVVFRRLGKEALADRIETLVSELSRWDGYLEGRDYLAGERFTLADIAVFPLLMHFEALGYDYAGRTPALAAYMARCKARPSVQQTGWLDVFGAFVKERAPEPVLAE